MPSNIKDRRESVNKVLSFDFNVSIFINLKHFKLVAIEFFHFVIYTVKFILKASAKVAILHKHIHKNMLFIHFALFF